MHTPFDPMIFFAFFVVGFALGVHFYRGQFKYYKKLFDKEREKRLWDRKRLSQGKPEDFWRN
jgi:hypothetical protein